MFLRMRTTLYIEDRLLKAVKKQAAEEGRTFTDFTTEALRESLLRRNQTRGQKRKIQLPVFKGEGLQSGVDLDNNAALLERMENDTL